MEKMYIVSILVSCFIYAVVATHSDCGSKVGTLTSLVVEGCDDAAARCILKRNTNASITISFTPKENSNELNAVVHGVILGVPAPFILENPNGCESSGISCPLESGKTYTYTATLPILRKYPRVTVDVKWQLQDKDENDIVCVLIPSKLA